MENLLKTFTDKIEAKYKKFLGELQDRKADIEIEMEKIDLEEKLIKAKKASSENIKGAIDDLNIAWNSFEKRYKSLIK